MRWAPSPLHWYYFPADCVFCRASGNIPTYSVYRTERFITNPAHAGVVRSTKDETGYRAYAADETDLSYTYAARVIRVIDGDSQ